jgi:hypothetical protein
MYRNKLLVDTRHLGVPSGVPKDFHAHVTFSENRVPILC